MERAFLSFCDAIIPDILANALKALASHTGLKWGVTPASQYWFQPPKVHIMLFILSMIFCAALHRRSRNFKFNAIAQLELKGIGSSVKCPINKLIAYVLLVCMTSQLYAKGTRPKPLVQMGWLLMPCYIFTALWIYILLHDAPASYGRNCYLATLMIDWLWGPVGAALQPDWSDHQHSWEGHVFFVHHTLLLLLPLYYAARYDTLALSWPHLFHLTWVATFVNFAIFAPYALLTGLNLNYQLAPPHFGGELPAVFRSVLFRLPCVAVFMALSVLSNTVTREAGKWIRAVFAAAKRKTQQAKPKTT